MADDVQTVPGEHGKKIAYAKDNMERMPYEYYTKSFSHYRCVEAALPFSAVVQRLL
jgi:hypothetical protein